jgi:hypothetical protein
MLDVSQLKQKHTTCSCISLKLAKCKQSGILTAIQHTNSLQLYILATELKYKSKFRHIANEYVFGKCNEITKAVFEKLK